MTKWAAALAVMLAAAGGGAWTASAETGRSPAPAEDSVAVFITGSTLGSLRPCGCSGGQLGGLERRTAILHSVPPSSRLILDIGHWVKQDLDQDLIKARILTRAFQLLGYDVVHLADQDLVMAHNLGLLGEMTAGLAVITRDAAAAEVNVPGVFEKAFTAAGRGITVRLMSVGEQALRARLEAPSSPDPIEADGVDVYIVDKLDPSLAEIQAGAGSRPFCIVGPAESDEPKLWSPPNAESPVFSLGRYGRHVVRLLITREASQAKCKLQFSAQTVSEDLPNDPSLVALYKDYQQIVADSGLLGRYRKVPLPKDLEYVGSKVCRQCHQSEHDQAASQKHAKAYSTLQKAGSHLDPECVICHAVGLDYEGGFVSVQETPELTDVGCEACHGPGSEHLRTEGKGKTCLPKRGCLDCHTPEQSGGYAGHETELLEKTRHWRELRKANRVQQ